MTAAPPSPALPEDLPSGTVVADEWVPARAPWSKVVRAGQILRIVDVEGNQAVDCVLYLAADTSERYSAADTMAAQANVFLAVGTTLLSTER
ncbi:MAG: urea carboxylase-associated family protein, partial [Acidimicrobiia bacterium]